MTGSAQDPRSPEPVDDTSIVPGLGGPTGPLDMSQDPDRYDPARDTGPAGPTGPLDMSQDPDRYDRTLPELLGEGAFEEPRETSQWLLGLLGVIAFLALVSWLFGSVLSG
ncbi:MAG TPA: hypothetical protein VNU66_04515 [Mycobacteriales bacterium]|nr:hypothetical protein [Mycobacteriales bacterium]